MLAIYDPKAMNLDKPIILGGDRELEQKTNQFLEDVKKLVPDVKSVPVCHRVTGEVRYFNLLVRSPKQPEGYAGAENLATQLLLGAWRFATEKEVSEHESKEAVAREDAGKLKEAAAMSQAEKLIHSIAQIGASQKKVKE